MPSKIVKGKKPGPKSIAEREELKARIHAYAAKRYTIKEIAQTVGVNWHTAKELLGEACKDFGDFRKQKGFDDASMAIATQEQIIAEVWSTLQEIRDAIASDAERIAIVNDMLLEKGKAPAKSPLLSALPFYGRTVADLLRVLGQNAEVLYKIQGLFEKQENPTAWTKEEFQKMLEQEVVIKYIDVSNVPVPEWEDIKTEEDAQRISEEARKAVGLMLDKPDDNDDRYSPETLEIFEEIMRKVKGVGDE